MTQSLGSGFGFVVQGLDSGLGSEFRCGVQFQVWDSGFQVGV